MFTQPRSPQAQLNRRTTGSFSYKIFQSQCYSPVYRPLMRKHNGQMTLINSQSYPSKLLQSQNFASPNLQNTNQTCFAQTFRERRLTFGFQTSPKIAQASHLTSPRSTLKPKITFCYGNKQNELQKNLQFVSNQKVGLTVANHSQQYYKRVKSMKVKKIFNKICPKIFEHLYDPKANKSKFLVQNYQKQTIQFEKPQMLIQRTTNTYDKQQCIQMSKIVSIPTRESINTSNLLGQHDRSTRNHNLDDLIISGLQAIPQSSEKICLDRSFNTFQEYSFGGLISHQNHKSNLQSPIVLLQSPSTRKWKNQIDCLISKDDTPNLKRSIHCSPDLPKEPFVFELLDKFGRSIKESQMNSAHEITN